ncbi:Reverse transcriptase (RNA-dependent DNA polymerase) domain-containing protein [Desulfonema limicola]|uniref:RNA-directed DNA polymerase n=1 Tax=Desulfonema limicola TaxID=45656 RepID=A0A975GHP7_9BACT|nr:reverse transcriptase domain-containing protein [Desulfonema limicola]QTA81765.1 Reverse transcriptase (RNA-dependent DNA polymerase) domain-containing protein [Desulfonema limicola]
MSELLIKSASPENLNRAWRKHRSEKTVWITGLSRKEMEPNLAFHLLKLSEDLRKGRYKPEQVRFFPVSKGDGGQRIISALCLRDKVAQSAVLSVIQPMAEAVFHDFSFGYRRNRNIDMALAKCREFMLCGTQWVVDADIKGFFDNIPHGPLMKKVKALIKDNDVCTLIEKWLDSGTYKRGFLARAKGIPQGSILSPILCNIYMNDFDWELSSKNLPFLRYADDFIVFAKTKEDALKAMDYIGKYLKRLGLELNMKKTRVAQAGPGIVFLGRKLPKIKK